MFILNSIVCDSTIFRLSVAISAMGDPKIIFMDEPTTGYNNNNNYNDSSSLSSMYV